MVSYSTSIWFSASFSDKALTLMNSGDLFFCRLGLFSVSGEVRDCWIVFVGEGPLSAEVFSRRRCCCCSKRCCFCILFSSVLEIIFFWP